MEIKQELKDELIAGMEQQVKGIDEYLEDLVKTTANPMDGNRMEFLAEQHDKLGKRKQLFLEVIQYIKVS